jgi:hypothetical protein
MSPADTARAKIEKTAADATAALNQMVADFKSSPDYRIEQLQREIAQLAACDSNGAASRRAVLQSQLITAETEQKSQAVVLTDEQRIDLAMAGKIDHVGAQTTSGQPDNPQLPVEDFVSAVQDDLALGIRPELVKAFHATGKSGDPLGHVAGQYWLDQLASDKDMQARLAAGDSVMKRRFRAACIYVSGRCGDATAEEEAAYRNWLAASPRQGR